MANRYTKGGGWSDAEIATLVKMRKERETYGAIAAALGNRTRSACVAQGTRLGLGVKRNAAPYKRKTPRNHVAHTKPTAPKPEPQGPAPITLASYAGLRFGFVDELPQGNAVSRKSLLDLRADDCRWPIGDPRDPDFRFCGQPKDGPTYCAHHRARAYGGQPRVVYSHRKLRKYI